MTIPKVFADIFEKTRLFREVRSADLDSLLALRSEYFAKFSGTKTKDVRTQDGDLVSCAMDERFEELVQQETEGLRKRRAFEEIFSQNLTAGIKYSHYGYGDMLIEQYRVPVFEALEWIKQFISENPDKVVEWGLLQFVSQNDTGVMVDTPKEGE